MRWLRCIAIFVLPLCLHALTSFSDHSFAEEQDERFLKGRLLVATPELEGTFFSQSVIYMIEHDQTGAFGLLVNRSLGILQIKPLFETLGFDAKGAEGEVLARIGGP
ncbi:MAG: YqgE/AlgH family protein, partial [Kiloniellales bacterium]|nr:YqgE/AlgH family protein [Kiloniellales bacterium]